jgi:hypothetical protein
MFDGFYQPLLTLEIYERMGCPLELQALFDGWIFIGRFLNDLLWEWLH